MGKGRKARTPEEAAQNFWNGVTKSEPDECWLWQRSCWGLHREYGCLSFQGRKMSAHCVAYILTFGEIQEGLEVCHSCDNSLCCNPRHLWLGTHLQNMQDMGHKGRAVAPYGEKHHKAKLTTEDVFEIRHSLAEGVRIIDLAARYHVTGANISAIKSGKSWSKV